MTDEPGENGDEGYFFALPPGIADLEDSDQSICATGADFAEEEDEPFLSGEETTDFNSLFTPPSKKYEALRNNQGAPPLHSLWAFSGPRDDTAFSADATRYSSAESLFSKDFLPFQLRGKTSASTGDIPHLSPPVIPAPDVNQAAHSLHDSSPPKTVFLPESPPRIDDRSKYSAQIQPYPVDRSRKQPYSANLVEPHSPFLPGAGYRASSPIKIHSGAPNQVLSPPRGSPPGVLTNGYPPYFPVRGQQQTRPRSQSIPTNASAPKGNTPVKRINNKTSGQPPRGDGTVLEQYPYQQHHGLPLPKPGPYGFPTFNPAPSFNRQTNMYGWQGYPGNSATVYHNSNNPAGNGAKGPARMSNGQRYPSPRGGSNAHGYQPSLSAKALREKLLDNQDVSIPPPAQKRKVKGTWQVKAKAAPKEEQKQEQPREYPPSVPSDEQPAQTSPSITEAKNLQLNSAEPEQPRRETMTKDVETQPSDQPSFLVLESKNNETVQLAVAELTPPFQGEKEEPSDSPVKSDMDEEESRDKTAGQKKKQKQTIVPKQQRRRKSGKKKIPEPKFIDVVISNNLKPEHPETEIEPGVTAVTHVELVPDKFANASAQRRKANNKQTLVVPIPENDVNGDTAGCMEEKHPEESMGFAWFLSSLLYVIMISAGISLAVLESSFSLLARLHKDAYLALLMGYNVSASVMYIYAFPYLVAPFLPITEWAPAILWYLFLGWFLFVKGASVSNYGTSTLGLKVFLPVLFLAEGVRNPTFVTYWSGGERLLLAGVLLSLRGNHFFSKRCLLSSAIFVVLNRFIEQSEPSLLAFLLQWAILLVGLSNHYQCCSSLASPLRLTRKHLSLCRYLGRPSSLVMKIRAAQGRLSSSSPPRGATAAVPPPKVH